MIKINMIYYYYRFILYKIFRVWIGIKSLLDLIEVARQSEVNSRAAHFLAQLEETGGFA